jgi:hypothetical protein
MNGAEELQKAGTGKFHSRIHNWQQRQLLVHLDEVGADFRGSRACHS